MNVPQVGLETKARDIQVDVPAEQHQGGGSDDIGDVSWTAPTILLRYPANIPNLPGHHWANAIAIATPIAHKGTTAGARAQAMMLLDLLMRPALVASAKAYFAEQTKTQTYESFLAATDAPALDTNTRTMNDYRAEMRKFYFDSSRYKTYLDQRGIKYPTIR